MPRRTILHLIDTVETGGAETMYLKLIDRLDPSRWRSIAAVPERGWLYDRLEEHGIEPVLVPSDGGSFDVRYLLRLVGMLRREQVDVIQSHLLMTSVYGSVAARCCGVPLVGTLHGMVDVAPDDRLRGAKFRLLDRRRNRLVFVSEALRRWFLGMSGMDPARTAVVHNGIDLRHFRPERSAAVREELGIPAGAFLVGVVGDVRPPKAYDVLLDAAAILCRRSPDFRFVVAGEATDGELYAGLLERRRALGLEDRVTFLGYRTDVARLMNAFDVYLITSSSEGFSLSTVEAMACEVPVVATRCGGPEEIVADGVTGRLVPVGSAEAIAGAVEALREDPDARRRLARDGREHVEREFALDTMVRRYETLYEEGIAATRRNRARAGERLTPAPEHGTES